MKKLLILLVVLLSGCVAVDAVLMTHFDPNEYLIITRIKVDALRYKQDCHDMTKSTKNADSIQYQTELYLAYEQELNNNDNGIKAAKDLNEIALGLHKRYSVGKVVPPLFCELKYGAIENSAMLIQHVIGGRPR